MAKFQVEAIAIPRRAGVRSINSQRSQALTFGVLLLVTISLLAVSDQILAILPDIPYHQYRPHLELAHNTMAAVSRPWKTAKLLLLGLAASPAVVSQNVPNYTTSEAGNPFVDTFYADPDTEIYDGLYWVFPTSSYDYEEQIYMDCFSSPDLVNWTKYPNILTADNVSWANEAMWAPATVSRNGKYYLYFAANDIQEGEPEQGKVGGIGVAVADRPEGPYVDAIGSPLIGEYHNGAQPIDQDVFIDDDGQAYIYYGGHSHANVAKLNEDMISLGTFDDGTTFKEITPTNYVEGSQMIKLNATYYLMWSEGGWTGPDYAVSYAMSDSPLGPFDRLAKILQQDDAVARGSGHNAVIQVPNTDIFYIVYHRRALSDNDGNHRMLAYDRMYFNDDGTIANVEMLVHDNFDDGNAIAWAPYGGGTWAVAERKLNGQASSAATTPQLFMMDTNFTDCTMDALVTLRSDDGIGGLAFRATGPPAAANGTFEGYYFAHLDAAGGSVKLWAVEGSKTRELAEESLGGDGVVVHNEYHIRVSAVGGDFQVFVDDMDAPVLEASDSSLTIGANGVGMMSPSGATIVFDDFDVSRV